MKNLLGQSAIEYLMTYGWMLLVVAIVGGAIFSMVGEQNIENTTGFNSQDITVRDFGITENNGLIFSVSGFLDQTTIRRVSIKQEDSSEINYLTEKQLSETSSLNFPGLKPAENTNEIEVEIIYDTGRLENLTVEGRMMGSFEIDSDFDNRTLIMNNLIGYWPLTGKYSGSNQVLDLSVKNNHPEINGTLSEAHNGHKTYFTNDTYLIKNDPELGQMEDSFTISNWAKLNDSGGSTEYPSTVAVTSSSGSSSTYAGFKRDNYGERVRCVVNTDAEGFTHTSEDTPELEGRYFYSCVWNGQEQELRLYRDGDLVTSSGTTGQQTNLGDQLTFAGHPQDGEYFSGELSEVTIYDRALTSQEIKILYDNLDLE